MKNSLIDMKDKTKNIDIEKLVEKYYINRKYSPKSLDLLNDNEIELTKEMNLSNKNEDLFKTIKEIIHNLFQNKSYGERIIFNHKKNEIIYETYSIDGHKGEEFDNKLYHLNINDNHYIIESLKGIFYNENIYFIGIREERKLEEKKQKKYENIFEKELEI
jgi:hypothetical protein